MKIKEKSISAITTGFRLSKLGVALSHITKKKSFYFMNEKVVELIHLKLLYR